MNLPERANSHRERPRSLRFEERASRGAPGTKFLRIPNAVGRRADALGIARMRLAALLSTRHGIVCTGSEVARWLNGDDVPHARHFRAVAEALAAELRMPLEDVLAAFAKAEP